MEINQIILLSVLLIFFVYYGGKYVPTVLRQNKEILVGVVGGLVLCVFLKSRVEGVCSVDNIDGVIDKVETDCGNLNSFPNNCPDENPRCADNCPSEKCAETLISWFNGNEPEVGGERPDRCDGTESLFQTPQGRVLYTGLQNLTSSCETLLMTDLDTLRGECPEGISTDSSVSCGCALKEYINKFNDNRNVSHDFWRSQDINKILKDLLTDRGENSLIRDSRNRTPAYIESIYNRGDLICTSPKGPNAPTPLPEPTTGGRSCRNINPEAIDNVNSDWGDREFLTFLDLMNCSCKETGDNYGIYMSPAEMEVPSYRSGLNFFGRVVSGLPMDEAGERAGAYTCQAPNRYRTGIMEGTGEGEINRPTCEANTYYNIMNTGDGGIEGARGSANEGKFLSFNNNPFSEYPGCKKVNEEWQCNNGGPGSNNTIPCKCPIGTKSQVFYDNRAPSGSLRDTYTGDITVGCVDCTEEEIRNNTHNCG